ncbi:Ser/Thr-rich T10 in DGCR region [Heracleum sosnowskyi]|uniref:Ser/Thr-rich T10 in DGCR region n=1 Tax=Heracleum sosnowskyi TaxID=360622 RepID=A0AAD8HV36_9APIA|nr:Ser/Thr-rich T10 in DGCR region [Heracleum sosnowskyi]
MCIGAFIWQAHPIYPFLLVLNRDEYHDRLTIPLEWWEQGGGGGVEILGGRDGVAGGTWLASSKHGKLAFLTNVRELHSLPNLKSRGHLPVRFLESEKDPMMFAEDVFKEADQYNGFNLIVADIYSKSMVYVTNRPKHDTNFIKPVSPGIHVLTNANLDTPWPKAQRVKQHFTNFLNMYANDECPIGEMSEKIMRDTIKDEKEMLPGIFPPEWEHQLSSIYVDIETPKGHYGTRSTSVVSVKTSGEVTFFETRLESSLWKDKTMSYMIENIK